MMFTVPMEFLSAAILTKDAAAVSDELLRIGSLEAVRFKEASGVPASSSLREGMAASDEADRIRDARRRVEGFLALADPPIKPSDPSLFDSTRAPDMAVIEKTLNSVASDIQALREGQKDLQEQLLRMEELGRQAESHLRKGVQARLPQGSSSFLAYLTGSMAESEVQRMERELGQLPAVTIQSPSSMEGRRSLALVCLKRDESRVRGIASRYGWKEGREGESGTAAEKETLKEIEARKEILRLRLEDKAKEFALLFDSRGKELADLWGSLRADELSLRMRSTFSRTDSVSMISGWIPASDRQRVEDGIRKASGGRCYIQWLGVGQAAPDGSDPPVSMKNPGFLTPFQTLVTNFGIPRYGTVDPTPFVAVAYLAMFGLMFGDAGHGLVLVAIGAAWLRKARRGGKGTTLAQLILYCGFSAVLSGLLFGAFFGRPLLPALWFSYHGVVMGDVPPGAAVRSIYDILGITIRFGMAVLAAGFLINWVNLAKARDWRALLFDKTGIPGGWIYGAGAWAAFYFVGHAYKELPPAALMVPLLGIPTVLLGLKEPMDFLEKRRRGKEGPFKAGMAAGFAMEWLVGILEVYSGYLANTLSFMRVAGLGIAHVSLMAAFSQIAAMASPDGGISPAGVAILVLGNVLVIALEGLSAGIQSLRLNYYEFFSKYFNGTGRAYRPISFRSIDT